MYSTYGVTLWRIRLSIVANGNASIRSLFVLDVDVAVGYIKVYIVVMKMRQWLPFALLYSCKIYRIVFTRINT
jgi:hypothetical protein